MELYKEFCLIVHGRPSKWRLIAELNWILNCSDMLKLIFRHHKFMCLLSKHLPFVQDLSNKAAWYQRQRSSISSIIKIWKKTLLTADTANLDFYPEFSIQFRMCHPKNLTSEKTTTHELNHDLTFYFILTQSIVYLCQRSMFRVLWIYSFDQTVENWK